MPYSPRQGGTDPGRVALTPRRKGGADPGREEMTPRQGGTDPQAGWQRPLPETP